MRTVTIYGSSDDLIEIEGDIREEFSHYDDDPAYLAVSDGTLIRVQRDNDGVWRIVPLHVGTAAHTHTFGKDDRDHTDRLTLTGDELHWVVCGTAKAVRAGAPQP